MKEFTPTAGYSAGMDDDSWREDLRGGKAPSCVAGAQWALSREALLSWTVSSRAAVLYEEAALERAPYRLRRQCEEAGLSPCAGRKCGRLAAMPEDGFQIRHDCH